MNWKKVSSTLLVCAMVITALVTIPAVANALDVGKCRIVKIGADPRFEGAPVQLVDETGVNWTGFRQFYLSSALGNQGLAVLLTAYSMGKTVWVRIADPATSGSLITVIFVNDQVTNIDCLRTISTSVFLSSVPMQTLMKMAVIEANYQYGWIINTYQSLTIMLLFGAGLIGLTGFGR